MKLLNGCFYTPLPLMSRLGQGVFVDFVKYSDNSGVTRNFKPDGRMGDIELKIAASLSDETGPSTPSSRKGAYP